MTARTSHAPHSPRRIAAPPSPIEALDRTHIEALEHLRELQRLPDHLQQHGLDPTARRIARRLCAFFGDTMRGHHADEERHVFPSLLGSGDAELVQQVRRLQQDHGWLEEDWLELSAQLQAVAAGYDGYEVDTLRRGIEVFAALLCEHVALEERVIYPETRRRLDEDKAAGDRRRVVAGR